MHLSNLKLTLLFDNIPCDPQLEYLWGFSCLVELANQRLLFDTGSNGRALLRNMQALNIEPAGLDFLFISHAHWDHIGGLDSVLELNPDLHLIVPSGISPRMMHDLGSMCGKLTEITEAPGTFALGLASTGVLPGEPPEHALVITLNEGSVVITGCAHPGIATIAEAAIRQTERPLALLAGGFHLFEVTSEEVVAVTEQLTALDIDHIMPTHCTGPLATQMLRERFGSRLLPGGLGQTIEFNAEGRPEARMSI
jgi:7,8-dihydropterin-6-yl-methyl-4-(beta-D-ribofuranosyl)aminobenzene 5'-phosphate synthase